MRHYTAIASAFQSHVRIGYDDASFNDRDDGPIYEAVIERSHDGTVWEDVPVEANGFSKYDLLSAVCYTGQNFVIVGASQQRSYGALIAVSTTLGRYWYQIVQTTVRETINDEDDSVALFAVAAYNPVVIAVGDYGVVLFSADNGLFWEVAGFGNAGYYDEDLGEWVPDPLLARFDDKPLTGVDLDEANYYIIGLNTLYTGGIGELGSNATLVEQMFVGDSAHALVPQQLVDLSDGVALMSAPNQIPVMLNERLIPFSSSRAHIPEHSMGMSEALTISTQIRQSGDVEMTSSLAFSDALLWAHTIALSASLALGSEVDALLPPGIAIKDGVWLDAAVDAFSDPGAVTISDGIVTMDVQLVRQKFAASLVASLDLSAEGKVSLSQKVQESLSLSALMNAFFGVTFSAALSVDSTADGDIIPAQQQAMELMETWAYNTEGGQSSRYTNFEMSSLVATRNGVFASDGSSIFVLDGDTDAGKEIPCCIEWGTTDFGTAFEKGMDRVYLGVASKGQLVLRVVTNQRTEDWYQVVLDAEGQHGARIKIGKGLKARYWKFRLENFDGAGFDLESIEFKPVTMSRRVR